MQGENRLQWDFWVEWFTTPCRSKGSLIPLAHQEADLYQPSQGGGIRPTAAEVRVLRFNSVSVKSRQSATGKERRRKTSKGRYGLESLRRKLKGELVVLPLVSWWLTFSSISPNKWLLLSQNARVCESANSQPEKKWSGKQLTTGQHTNTKLGISCLDNQKTDWYWKDS